MKEKVTEEHRKMPKAEKSGLNRRSFMKKAAYAAPTLVIMGSLMRPTETKAGFGPPPSSPSTWE